MAKLRTFEFKVTINVDEDSIHYRYPNYAWNFSEVSEFISFLKAGMKTKKNNIDAWGYEINAGKLTEVK